LDLQDHADIEALREALRESEERFRTLAEAAPVLIWTSAVEGGCTYVNQTWLDFTGRSLADELGHGWLQGVHPEDVAGCLEVLKDSKARRTPFVIEYRLRRHDGHFRWILNTGIPRRSPQGEFLGFVGSLVDIDDRRRMEDKLRAYQEELRNLASEMSLAEERERRRIAAVLHDDIVQWLALTKIKLGGLGDVVSGDDAVRLVAELHEIVEQIIRETRGLIFKLSPPVLYELGFVSAVEWLGESMQEETGTEFSFHNDLGGERPPEELEIVLFHAVRELLTNVRKHADAGKVSIHIARQGRNLRIDLADDGVGFDLQRLNRRISNAGGFGLFSIRERLRLLGGGMDMKSRPGEGTMVALYAPLTAPEPSPTVAEARL